MRFREAALGVAATALLLGVLAFGQTGPGSLDPTVLRLLPPDAGLLLGIEWRKVTDSTAGGVLQKQLQEPGLASLPALKGLEKALREDIDSITLSAPARSLAGKEQQTPVLIVLKGRFHRAQLREWLTGSEVILARA